jgi:quaternary ammonium compound-resistance protein SugE
LVRSLQTLELTVFTHAKGEYSWLGFICFWQDFLKSAGLKMAQEAETRVLGITLAVGFMAVSGFLLWLAQKEIPIGTSYAIWTGIGAAGTFVVGVLYYGDPSSLGRYLGVALIIAGVATLKLAH